MATISSCGETQLMIGVERQAGATFSYSVCRHLAVAQEATGYLIEGLFACRANGVYMGCKISSLAGAVLNHIVPVRIKTADQNYTDVFTGVGMVGDAAGVFVQAMQNPLTVTAADLFGERIQGEPSIAVNSTLEGLTGLPAEPLLGICDKLKWLWTNDDNGYRLSIDWVFGPNRASCGTSVLGPDGAVISSNAPIALNIPDRERLYQFAGKMSNQIAGNATTWMIRQLGG